MGGSALDFTKNPLLCRSPACHAGHFVGKVGDFSFIYIFSSAHADFSVWALFFFVFRCAFVVLHFLPMRYTGCTRRDVL
nr:MAG TPA: hypothetical protein [Caudoviricetes sp.]